MIAEIGESIWAVISKLGPPSPRAAVTLPTCWWLNKHHHAKLDRYAYTVQIVWRGK